MEDRMEVFLSDPFGLSSRRQHKYHDLERSNKQNCSSNPNKVISISVWFKKKGSEILVKREFGADLRIKKLLRLKFLSRK